jgi:hypothetical protein
MRDFGWRLLPVATEKQRKLVLPINVILQDIQEKSFYGFLSYWVSM